jgi:hypothetical protein
MRPSKIQALYTTKPNNSLEKHLSTIVIAKGKLRERMSLQVPASINSFVALGGFGALSHPGGDAILAHVHLVAQLSTIDIGTDACSRDCEEQL